MVEQNCETLKNEWTTFNIITFIGVSLTFLSALFTPLLNNHFIRKNHQESLQLARNNHNETIGVARQNLNIIGTVANDTRTNCEASLHLARNNYNSTKEVAEENLRISQENLSLTKDKWKKESQKWGKEEKLKEEEIREKKLDKIKTDFMAIEESMREKTHKKCLIVRIEGLIKDLMPFEQSHGGMKECLEEWLRELSDFNTIN